MIFYSPLDLLGDKKCFGMEFFTSPVLLFIYNKGIERTGFKNAILAAERNSFFKFKRIEHNRRDTAVGVLKCSRIRAHFTLDSKQCRTSFYKMRKMLHNIKIGIECEFAVFYAEQRVLSPAPSAHTVVL